MNKKSFILGTLLIFNLLLVFIIFKKTTALDIIPEPNKFHFSLKQSQQDSDQYIKSQMKICFDTQGRDDCYKDLASVLMRQFNLKDILNSFAKNETSQEVFSRCHEETHYLSRIEYQKVGSIAKVYEQCDSTCHGGCYHGAVEQYLKNKNISLANLNSESVIKVIIQMCGRKQDYSKSLIYFECIHGIGHASMYVTNMGLLTSLKVCDLFSDQAEREACYGGVFMENSSSSTNSDHPGKFIKADNPMYPCDILDKQYLSLCYRYQSSYFASYSKWDWTKVGSLCAQVPQAYQNGCFETIGTNQVGFVQDVSLMKKNCSLAAGEEKFKSSCIQGIVIALAGRYVNQENRLLEFCESVDEANKKSCYQQIGLSISSWYQQPEDFKKVCNKIKSEVYASLCRGD